MELTGEQKNPAWQENFKEGKMTNFADRLIKEILKRRSYLCVGLDPQLEYFPPFILRRYGNLFEPGCKLAAAAIMAFNKEIIEATCEFALCYKPQMAFYEKYGSEGVRALEETIKYVKSLGILIIEDAKREDGGDTSRAYAEGHLGKVTVPAKDGELIKIESPYNVDAITITPWIDTPNFDPFVDQAINNGKGIFVVTKTSFKPVSRFQESLNDQGERMWTVLAEIVEAMGKKAVGEKGYSSVGVVMGATYPKEAEQMKKIIPKAFKLIPGFGAGQKGKAEDAVVSINDDGFGGIINNSRGTNYAWHEKFKTGFECDEKDFAIAAAKACEQARDSLNEAVKKKIGKLPWE